MYYYAVTGYSEVKDLVETTDEDGETINTLVTTQVPTKQIITKSQADAYVSAGTYTCYVVYDDGTEEEIIAEEGGEEELVGSSATMSLPAVATTYFSVPIDSIESGKTLIVNYTPTLDNYTLAGVIGYTISGTSYLMPFRVYVSNGNLYVGLRNLASYTITSKTMIVTLLWTLTGNVAETDGTL